MAECESDPRSPYYIDQGFYGYNLQRDDILSQAEDNYVFWKFLFRNILVIANKIGFIDGTLEKPDPSSPLYEPWKRCDSLVKLLLMNSMTEKLQKRVMYAGTARIMWEDLRRIFVPNLELKIYDVRQRIAMTRQNGDSVATYFGKLNKAWMELSEYDPEPECACDGCRCDVKKRAEEKKEKEERFTFLMGLNKSVSNVRTVIMLMEPPPSLHQALGMVERAESDLKTRR